MRVSFCIRALRSATFVAMAATISASAIAGPFNFAASDPGVEMFKFNKGPASLLFQGAFDGTISGKRIRLSVDGFLPNPILIQKLVMDDLKGTNLGGGVYSMSPFTQPATISFFDESNVLALKISYDNATLSLGGKTGTLASDVLNAQLVDFSGYAAAGLYVGQNFNISLRDTTVGSGLQRQYKGVISGSADAVPEPFTMMLGAAGIGAFVKRRASKVNKVA